MTTTRMNEVMKELKEYNDMMSALKSEIEKLQTEAKEYMNENELDELLGENGEHIVWKTVVSNRFDSTAFKKSEWAELYKEFTKPSETRPFKFYA